MRVFIINDRFIGCNTFVAFFSDWTTTKKPAFLYLTERSKSDCSIRLTIILSLLSLRLLDLPWLSYILVCLGPRRRKAILFACDSKFYLTPLVQGVAIKVFDPSVHHADTVVRGTYKMYCQSAKCCVQLL